MTAPSESDRPWGSTLRVRAEVLVTGGQHLAGFLHLQPNASSHLGPESPEDLLNRHGDFFPVTQEGGRTVFLAKSQVLAVVFAPQPFFDDPTRASAARNLKLTVQLSDGTEFAGSVVSEMPPDRARALDFLNDGRGFFALRSADAIRYLNRDHLRVVTPLD
jgi:hypothetical protein